MKQADKTNFWGARNEAMVAATFIRAGFDIEYEDESDGRSRLPEFVAVHRRSGERIAVEAKKRNRGKVPQNDHEVRLGILDLMKSAVGKFNGLPLVLFLELDLPPIEGDPMKKPWIKELMKSHEEAGMRDTDGKDFCNLIVFTNYPPEHPEDVSKYPGHSFIVTQSLVPKIPIKQPCHLLEVISTVERQGKIPSWFEE